MKIRKASEDDLSGILRLNLQLMEEGGVVRPERSRDYLGLSRYAQRVEWAKMLGNHAYTIFVAEEQGSVLGLICVSFPGYNPFKKVKVLSRIDLTVVDRSLRRKGVGTRLLASALEFLKSRGSSHVILEVNAENPAVHFWERRGFVRLSSSDFTHPDGSKEVLVHMIRRVD